MIMPSVGISYYTDMHFENRYFTYITEELPEMLSSLLPISIKREDNYVAGLSMGGYGAFKIALNFPQKYAMAASLSGALDRGYLYENCDKLNRTIFKYAYGNKENFVGSINDLLHMAILRKAENNIPELYMCCGTKDFLYDANIRYLNHLKSLDIPITYEEDTGYAHT